MRERLANEKSKIDEITIILSTKPSNNLTGSLSHSYIPNYKYERSARNTKHFHNLTNNILKNIYLLYLYSIRHSRHSYTYLTRITIMINTYKILENNKINRYKILLTFTPVSLEDIIPN